jgi:hypothetical protein
MPDPAADPAPSATTTGTEVVTAEPARDLPRVDARAWAIGFLIFGIVLAVVLSQTMIGFLAAAHATP